MATQNKDNVNGGSNNALLDWLEGVFKKAHEDGWPDLRARQRSASGLIL